MDLPYGQERSARHCRPPADAAGWVLVPGTGDRAQVSLGTACRMPQRGPIHLPHLQHLPSPCLLGQTLHFEHHMLGSGSAHQVTASLSLLHLYPRAASTLDQQNHLYHLGTNPSQTQPTCAPSPVGHWEPPQHASPTAQGFRCLHMLPRTCDLFNCTQESCLVCRLMGAISAKVKGPREL